MVGRTECTVAVCQINFMKDVNVTYKRGKYVKKYNGCGNKNVAIYLVNVFRASTCAIYVLSLIIRGTVVNETIYG